jgi:hypothetical protein
VTVTVGEAYPPRAVEVPPGCSGLNIAPQPELATRFALGALRHPKRVPQQPPAPDRAAAPSELEQPDRGHAGCTRGAGICSQSPRIALILRLNGQGT